MRKSVLAFVGVAVVIIIIAFVATRRRETPAGTQNSDTASDTAASQSGSNTSRANPNLPGPGRSRSNDFTAKPRNTPPAPTPVANANYLTNWEEKLDTILTSEKPDPDKAKEMIEMFPQLSPEAQEEIAHHISNLTPDENYSLGQFLTNSALPEAVLDVFTEDVLNRPNGIKLPLLLDVARDSQHPKAGEAKDILELFLEEDFGTDWTKWQTKMDQWLKDNPD